MLINGDCLIEMGKIADKSVDMILCDLPYGTTACKWDQVIPFEPLWAHYKRVIKENGAIVLFGSEPFSSHLRLSNLKWYKYDWIWKKNKGGNFFNAKFQPLVETESISVFYNKLPRYDPIMEERAESGFKRQKSPIQKGWVKENAVYGKSKQFREIISIKRYPSNLQKFNVERGLHPTQKPVALLEYLIKTYTNEGELVLDNCMGSGSAGVACKNLNRKFIGIEKEEKYFTIAQQRINGTGGINAIAI